MKFKNIERKEGDVALVAIKKTTTINASPEWRDDTSGSTLLLFHGAFLITIEEVSETRKSIGGNRETRKRKFLLEKSVATYDYETGLSDGGYEDVGNYARIEDAILDGIKLWIRQDVHNALEGNFWEEHGRECARVARSAGMTDRQAEQSVRKTLGNRGEG